MSLTKKFATFVAPVALAAGFSLAANDAAALDLKPGQCLPAAEMMSQLKAEGQRSVIVANRVWRDQEKKAAGRYINVFTSNDNGNTGYLIEGDSTLGEDKPATKFCLVSDYSEISLYNGRGNTVPLSVPQPSFLASVVQNEIDKRGFRPMLVAKRNGAVIVVSGNPDIKDSFNGVVFVGGADPNQKAGSLGSLAQTTYSSNIARDKLPAQDSQKVASLQVK